MNGTSLRKAQLEIHERIEELEYFISEIDEVSLPDDEAPLLRSSVRVALDTEMRTLKAIQERLLRVNRME